MYGFVLEGVAGCIRRIFGENIWQEIRQVAAVSQDHFMQKRTYSETVVPRILKAAVKITSKDEEDILEECGKYFVCHMSQYGYERVIRVLGRHLRDFLNNLDNLHEYLRFTYPKMRSPSFFVEEETRTGLTLHYRSKREGYLHYVIGQIHAIAETFYETSVTIDVLSEKETSTLSHVTMKIYFNNTAFVETEDDKQVDAILDTALDYGVLCKVFPFHIVYNRQMLIRTIGSGLSLVMPYCVGESIDEVFTLNRPLVEFSIENVLMYSHNVFELISTDTVSRSTNKQSFSSLRTDDELDERSHKLRLKGQMVFMSDWDAVLFIGTPILDNLEKLFETGIYINDLSMHDWSRDLVLVGTQQQNELKLALKQEKAKSKKLEESMKQIDKELKRTDALLYQMIPKTVADRLRQGESSHQTCQTFDAVTILFTDVVGFTSICSHLSPMEVVAMLNGMYTKFDQLTEKHRVYKVETIGDAYMVVSGAPTVTTFHALYITDMAFDMIEAIQTIKDPSKDSSLRIRVGIHTGPVVGGVVGVKMPRYCLVGETVHIANNMESSGKPLRIHISETTRKELVKYPYIMEEAEPLPIKNREAMPTYWCNGKTENAMNKKGPKRFLMQD